MVDNTVQAADVLDNSLSAEAINFLLDTRRLVITVGSEIETEAELLGHELIQALPFSHPRVSASVMGYAPTDGGQKVLSVLDDRHWSDPNTPLSAPAATSVKVVPDDVEVTVVPEDTVGMSNEDVKAAVANDEPIPSATDPETPAKTEDHE